MMPHKIARGFAVKVIFVLLFSLAGSAIPAAALPVSEKQVLVLHSYHRWWKWTEDITRGVEDALSKGGVPHQLAVEYMDTKRVYNEEYLKQLGDIYRQKYGNTRFDVIVSSDDNAFNFLLQNRDSLFPGAPVVFCGVNNFNEDLLKGVSGFTGVREELDLRTNIDLILRQHPDPSEVVVLLDPTPTGRNLTAEVEGIITDYPDVKWRLLTDHSMDEVIEVISGLPVDAVVLYVVFFRDAKGVFYEFYQGAEMISSASSVPVYAALDFYLGYGVVGGMVVSGYHQGNVAGGLALRILRGEPAGTIPVVKKSPNRYIFDHRVLERFNIPVELLPPGSELINRPRTLFTEYSRLMGWIISAGVLLVLLLVVMGMYIVSRRRTQIVLAESEERFRTAFQTSPDPMVILRLTDRTFVDVNAGFSEHTGFSPEQAIGRNSSDLGLWKDPADQARLYELVESDGRIDNLEAEFMMADQTSRTGLVSARMMTLGGLPHLIVMIKDVSRIKETEGKLRDSLVEKELLLKEIHHRVKNNLQVISGLLDLQAHHITDEKSRGIYKESQNRVITMALIHEELYKTHDIARVEFGTYLENLTKNLMGSYNMSPEGVELLLEVEHVNVVVDTAIPCGLVVNELVSNALKHAFPEGRKGTIKVLFHAVSDDIYELEVADNGVGLPPGVDVFRSGTLGMQLVKVIAEQLGGELKIDQVGGVAVRITFKEYMEADTSML